jgi:FkbM family methyltransferase
MKSYSQNGEDIIVQNHFGDFKGTVLSLGENDGRTLSNSYALIENGWNGVLVEPSELVFKKLEALHKQNENVVCLNYAIANKDEELEFFESGPHLGADDFSLLSTLKRSEVSRWNGTGTSFHTKKVNGITFKTLLEKSPYKKFDFITIDIEGLDYEVLTQIDLNEVGCRMLCIETNSIEDYKYVAYCQKFGMRVLSKTHENLIFVK